MRRWLAGFVIFASACRDPAPAPPPAATMPAPPVIAMKDAAVEAAVAEPAVATNDYYSLKVDPHDEQNAHRLSFEAFAPDGAPALAEAVVVCRVAVVEPAPLPTTEWDRRNGRDLALEVLVDGAVSGFTEGPLGNPVFFARADDVLRDAASGKQVRFVLRDRDQSNAYPYRSSVILGGIDIPRDAKLPLDLRAPTMRVECRGATRDVAAKALLPAADRALADAEKKLAWTAEDPRSVFEIRDALHNAAQAVRVASVLAQSVKLTDDWAQRETRLRDILRAYLAKAKIEYDRVKAAPVGTWVSVGPRLVARVVAIVCPAIATGEDPGSLNDDQRTACGLTMELKSSGDAKVRWDADPWGPAYACREQGPLRIGALEGPAQIEGRCILGFRRGGKWQKKWVELSPTEPTTVVLGGASHGKALRVSMPDGAAWLAVPSAAPDAQ
jgi:hypothetical protein